MNSKADYTKFNKKQSVKRLIALVTCALFITGALLSAAFVFTHINHKHDHNAPDGGCVVCAQISVAENLLKSLSAALAGAGLILGCLSAIRSILKLVSFNTDFLTLVHLKIRLNN